MQILIERNGDWVLVLNCEDDFGSYLDRASAIAAGDFLFGTGEYVLMHWKTDWKIFPKEPKDRQ